MWRARRSKRQRIRVNADIEKSGNILGRYMQIDGWLDGKGTYVEVRVKLGTIDVLQYAGRLSGQRLYRLAKAIVRRFEE